MDMFKRGLAFLMLLSPLFVNAQTFETGGLLAANYQMQILEGWHWNARAEFRFDGNFTHYDRLRVGAGTEYSFWEKRIKVGVSYDYLNYHIEHSFENRHRVTAALTWTEKWGGCKLSYRAAFQSTFYDERRAECSYNPKIYMRNRLSFVYQIPEKPLKLHASEEFWLRLNHPDRKIVDDLRTIVGVEYAINKRHSLDLYLRSDNEVLVPDPKNIFYLGITYSFD